MAIYFMKLMNNGNIKIGFTDNVSERYQRLKRHYKCEIQILHVMEGRPKEESEIHEQFKHLRIGRTDQFRPARDLLESIGHSCVLNGQIHLPSRRSPRSHQEESATSLQVLRRDVIGGRVEDEESLIKISEAEIERLAESQHDLLLILPSVTITAKHEDTRSFVQLSRHELGKWNRWLCSWLGNGNKRRAFRKRSKNSKHEFRLLVAGFFTYEGSIEDFARFEKTMKPWIQRRNSSGRS